MELYAYFRAVNVYVPKDRVMNLHQGYRFVEFRSEQDADYISFPILKLLYSSPIPVKDVVSDYKFVVLTAMPAIKVLNMIKLYGKAIRVNKLPKIKRVWMRNFSTIFSVHLES
ncbi:uncharacterized protein LOC112184796 [Rosa chinensis]|uniref:uncharacterized protein LOC112184796 n=1 Tax=Rosa chinensis TaxID=74649 RepID=UPI000D08F62F|nr:uncharacterized protein LOC112184796 [Rosa chinensis]